MRRRWGGKIKEENVMCSVLREKEESWQVAMVCKVTREKTICCINMRGRNQHRFLWKGHNSDYSLGLGHIVKQWQRTSGDWEDHHIRLAFMESNWRLLIREGICHNLHCGHSAKNGENGWKWAEIGSTHLCAHYLFWLGVECTFYNYVK